MLSALRKISLKLAVLAGVPVIGALLLATQITDRAHERQRSAEAIGSIEDLAQLSTHISAAVDELETERALAALTIGLADADEPRENALTSAKQAFVAQETKTEAAVQAMDSFLGARDIARLPARLRSDLAQAHAALQHANGVRTAVAAHADPIDQALSYYDEIAAALIDATAALTRLSSDAELLRAISSLVAVMQVEECDSRIHAVLSHTFASGEFAPGSYRSLVTLVTERSVHIATLESFATSEQVAEYRSAMAHDDSARASEMLRRALEATEGDLGVAASDWFPTEQSKIRDLTEVKRHHAEHVLQVAHGKVAEARRAARFGEILASAVLLISLALAFTTGRGITRSVVSLARLADKVRKDKDFSLRATKTSKDELGALTDAFNEMLGDLQERDEELRQHRENLENLVNERTSALSAAYKDLQGEVDTRERLERELRLAQKLEAIGQLSAGVAHEINTPMQYIGDNIDFLGRAFSSLSDQVSSAEAALSAGETHSLEELRTLLEANAKRLKLAFVLKNTPKALADAKSGVSHVSSIVRAMKSFAHVDEGEKTPGDVNQGIRDTLVVAQSEYKAVASVETDLGEVPAVPCYPGRLNQVFLNLVINAAHAISEAARGEGGKIRVSSRVENDMVVIAISDNGTGIPEHVQHKVFDQFFTTKPVGKGTGQGLSLARSIIVEAHQGTLSFDTTPGAGTTFRIGLPLRAQGSVGVVSGVSGVSGVSA